MQSMIKLFFLFLSVAFAHPMTMSERLAQLEQQVKVHEGVEALRLGGFGEKDKGPINRQISKYGDGEWKVVCTCVRLDF